LKYYFTKEGKLKKLILLFLLISNPVWAAELKIPPCFTDCTFDSMSSSTVTTGKVVATKGVYKNISTSGTIVTNDGTLSAPAINIGGEGRGFYESGVKTFWVSGGASYWLFATNEFRATGGTGGGSIGKDVGTPTNPVFRYVGDTDSGQGWAGENQPNIISGSVEATRFGNTTTTFYPSGSGQVKIDDSGSIIANGSIAFSSITTLISSGDAPIPYHHFHCDATAGDVTFDMHSSASGPKGLVHNFLKIDSSANDCILDGAGGETFSGLTTITISTQWENITIYTDQSNWFIE
jgi:hypothetical protein